jgi:hypothetical protein
MTDEVQTLAEVDSAQAPEVTATEERAQNAPEVAEQSEQQPEEKRFTQAELDAMIGKRLAREQRKWEREQQAKQPPPRVPAEVPPADQFDSTEAYAEALAERRAQELVQQREAAKRQAEIIEAYHDKEDEIRGKYDDFDQVAYNPQLRITDVMAETIRESDTGPELAYYLGQNPKEAERISRLSPFLQAKEIGKIEVKLAENPPVKKTSSAPAPISPVSARISNTGVVDTTDPRSTKNMSDSEWIEAERRRQIAKLQAQRNR